MRAERHGLPHVFAAVLALAAAVALVCAPLSIHHHAGHEPSSHCLECLALATGTAAVPVDTRIPLPAPRVLADVTTAEEAAPGAASCALLRCRGPPAGLPS